MKDIAQQRCFNHPEREAAARCLECGRFYCRECVTEHEARVICAFCLRKLAKSSFVKRSYLTGFLRITQCLLGILILWLFFYSLGRVLLRIPTAFHEGTVWQGEWWEE